MQPLSFLGTRWTGDGHGVLALLAVPSRSMASNSALATTKRSGAGRRGRQTTDWPGVVRIWCVVLCPTSRWMPVGFISSGNSSRMLSGGLPPTMTFTLGTDGGALRPGVDSEMAPSSRRLFLQSMRTP